MDGEFFPENESIEKVKPNGLNIFRATALKST